LAGNPLILLFIAIGPGCPIGNINIFGFKLGVDAVLLVGLALGILV
jgi:putative transport protein